ncbi:hypothetical protein GGF44_002525, partial [Coemansia sp. RSA 1694]
TLKRKAAGNARLCVRKCTASVRNPGRRTLSSSALCGGSKSCKRSGSPSGSEPKKKRERN